MDRHLNTCLPHCCSSASCPTVQVRFHHDFLFRAKVTQKHETQVFYRENHKRNKSFKNVAFPERPDQLVVVDDLLFGYEKHTSRPLEYLLTRVSVRAHLSVQVFVCFMFSSVRTPPPSILLCPFIKQLGLMRPHKHLISIFYLFPLCQPMRRSLHHLQVGLKAPRG